MQILDNYLDKYLAKKICYLYAKHYGPQNIVVDYDTVMKEYEIKYRKTDSLIIQFPQRESLIVLRNLLAKGWQES